jgi:hypothetical protein
MTIPEYIDHISKRDFTGTSNDHRYRPDLENPVRSISALEAEEIGKPWIPSPI